MHSVDALIRLALATRAHHSDADAAWTALLVDDVTETAYAAQLARVYGFEGPVEAALAYTPGLSARIDLRRRVRAGLIAQDLIALDLPPAQIAHLPALAIAPFANVVEALGWMYVVERATTLHGRIREYLIARLPRVARASSYLCAYETSIGSRWIELGNVIDRVARDPRSEAQLAAAASEAFRWWVGWSRRERVGVARGA